MKDEEIKLINFRKDRAVNTLKDAKLLFDNKSYYSAVNRIYYALFYEVCALLILTNKSSSKHTGIKSIFLKNYVKTGLLNKEIGKFYSKMFDFRHMGDYIDYAEFSEDEVKEWLEKAELFIKELDDFISKEIKGK